MALGATLARCRRSFSAWACWALTRASWRRFSLAASRLPAADLPQAFRVLAVALVPASRLVLASASFAKASPRARSPRSGQTAVSVSTVEGAHGSGNSQGKARGECWSHSPRALSKLEQDAYLPVYRLLENKTERQTVSSTRWEQEPRALPHQTIVFSRTRQRDKRSHRRAGNKNPEALPTERSSSREQDREINGLIAAWEQEPGSLPFKRSKALPNPRSVPAQDSFSGFDGQPEPKLCGNRGRAPLIGRGEGQR